MKRQRIHQVYLLRNCLPDIRFTTSDIFAIIFHRYDCILPPILPLLARLSNYLSGRSVLISVPASTSLAWSLEER